MSVAQNAPGARRATIVYPQQLSWPLGLLLDGAFAIAAYLAAYWLRFQGEQLRTFMPGALATLPLVVVGQLAALLAFRAYVRRPPVDWLFRVVGGVLAGTGVAGIVVAAWDGFEGLRARLFWQTRCCCDCGVRAAMKPVWNGSEFVPRLMVPLSLSYDHRVIDGAAAARFVAFLVNVLSDLRRALL